MHSVYIIQDIVNPELTVSNYSYTLLEQDLLGGTL